MKISTLIFSLFILAGCGSTGRLGKTQTDIQLLKEWAFCTCMNEGMKLYFQQDTLDVSLQQVNVALETRKITTKRILPKMNENVQHAVQQMVPVSGPYVHESVAGMNNYIQGCLAYYNSRRLDSLLKSFKKKDYAAF